SGPLAVRCVRIALAEMDRTRRARRRELHDAAAAARQVGVQAPLEILVEPFRAIEIGDRNDHDFEFHVDLGVAHDDLTGGWGCALAASWPRLSPSIRSNAGNGWITSARAASGTLSLIASTSSPTISPARGVTSVAPISTPRSRSATSFSAPR